MKTVVVGNKIFKETKYPVDIEPSIFEKRRAIDGVSRDTIRLTLLATYSEVAEHFVNGANWAIEESFVDENGENITNQYDKSEYSIASDIVDHRNGSVTVYMAKPTEAEKAKEALRAVLPMLDDEAASSVYAIFPELTIGE